MKQHSGSIGVFGVHRFDKWSLTKFVLVHTRCWTFQEKNIQGCRFFYTTHSKMFLALIYSGCTKNRNERQKHFSVGPILPFRENNIAVRYCINDLFLIKNVFLQVLSSCPSCCIIIISFHPVRVMEYSWQDAFIYTCTPGYYWWVYPISKIGWEPGKKVCNRIWAAILYQEHIIIYTCIFLVY